MQMRIDYDQELNDQQVQVVKEGEGSCLVLAGAGSGKTRTITYRVAYLLERGIDPSRILLLTFTNKAAREMIHRIEHILGPQASSIWAGTFHSVANRLLRRYADRLGYTNGFSILDQDDSTDLINLAIRELKIDTKGKRFPSARVMQSMISAARNGNIALAEHVEAAHAKFIGILHEIEQVADLYEKLKRTQNAMDFDDLLLQLLKLLRTDEEVHSRLADQFQYVLVDEFQDTNHTQAQLIRYLSSAHKNLLVVGDDAQSIYSFRGADIRNILNFPSQYPDTKTYQLTKNYRSTPEVLEVANAVIAHNTNQFKKELQAIRLSGERPSYAQVVDGREEAQYIADRIETFHEKGMPLSEIAVLFRVAFHSQDLEFELMRRNLPYEYRGGMKFFERAHIKDILSHLRVVQNPKDAVAWIRTLRLHAGIGIVTAQKIAHECQQVGVKGVGDLPPRKAKRARAGFEGFQRIFRRIAAAGSEPSQLIRAVASSSDYGDYLEAEYPNYKDRLDDLEQLALFAEQFSDLAAFLDAVSLTNEYGVVEESSSSSGEDRLILSTVHQAKGLEWNVVFMLRLQEGAFPHTRAYEEEGGVEEERRLFYVAVTRARQHLFLLYPMTSGYDRLETRGPSPFLEEIPKEALDAGRPAMPAPARPKMTQWGSADEPMIVLDDLGEEIDRPPAPSSFLRDIDEL